MIRSFGTKSPQIAQNAFIDETAVVIGDVAIGADSSVWPTTVIRGDIHKITIGSRSNIQDGSVIHVTHAGDFNLTGHPTLIGNEVIVGHRVVLHGCTIHDHVLIGMGAIVMDGAEIHEHVLVGAGSLVPPNKVLHSGLWVGSPVRRLRDLNEQELGFLRYSADYYVRLKDGYLGF